MHLPTSSDASKRALATFGNPLDLLFTTASKRVCGNDPWTELLTSRLAAVRGRLLCPMAVPIGTYNKPEDFCSALAKAMSAALSMDDLFGVWEQNVATVRALNHALKQIGNMKPDLAKDLVNHLKSCATALVKQSTHTAVARPDDKASSERSISKIAQNGIDKSALPIGEPKRHRSKEHLKFVS